MNRSMLVGTVLGITAATAIGSYALLTNDDPEAYADVTAVTPLTEQVRTPRQERHDETVTQQATTKDAHRVTGTFIGGVAGSVIGDAIGGGGDNTGAKIAGAVAGGIAGHEAQRKMQETNTITTTQQRCETVFDVSERTVGYRVDYRIGDETGRAGSTTTRVRGFRCAMASSC